MKTYNKTLLNKFDKAFSIIIGIAAVIAFIAAVLLFFANTSKGYSILNFISSIILSLVFIFRKKVKVSFKVTVIIVVTLVVAIASFIGGSVSSAFLSIIIISNIISALFLQPKYGIIVSIMTIIIFICLAVYSPAIDINNIPDPLMTWTLQIIGLALLLTVLNISAYYIKKQLIENIHDLEQSVEKSERLAYYDQLTGLPNMNKLLIDVDKMIETNKKDGFVAFIYVNSMGIVNATLGKEFGDKLLIEISEILKQNTGDNQYIARTGGGEFALWICNLDENQLYMRLNRIIADLRGAGTLLKKKLHVNVAYSSFKYGEDTLNLCYQRAAFALAYSKKNNLQKFTPYNDVIENELRRKELIKDLITEAIKEKKIELYYQPKYDSRSNKVVGVESLARWKTKELGFVSPSEFLPIIESLNQSVYLGNYVIEKALCDYSELQKKYNKDINISINISPSQLVNYDIVKKIKAILEKYNIPKNTLYIEITEEIIINNIDTVKPIISEIKKLGVKISLDDFGSGYSSLSYLTQLELDEIKVDKSFVDQIGENERILPLLENIMHLANRLHLSIIAEGVETKEQNDILHELGFYHIQGYYYARPEPLFKD